MAVNAAFTTTRWVYGIFYDNSIPQSFRERPVAPTPLGTPTYFLGCSHSENLGKPALC